MRNLSKIYKIPDPLTRHARLSDVLSEFFRHPTKPRASRAFTALNRVSFDLAKGEVVGIIGRNGAGKSTLLKILSRITSPSAGEVDLYGRVGSLLEVGTGFHQDLTGRENVYLNGAVLGMSRVEISQQFAAIVSFAGVEQFLDVPVKRYSSGMYVRLAFAVAAHLQADILIVDEVLAVGDSEFQRKCLDKLKQLSTDGRTVLLVSHNIQSLLALCTMGILLTSGELECSGRINDVVEYYSASKCGRMAVGSHDPDSRRGSGHYRIVEAHCEKATYRSGDELTISLKIDRRFGNVVRLFVILDLRDDLGNVLCHCDSRMRGISTHDAKQIEGECRLRTPWLKAGDYTVSLQLGAGELVDEWLDACSFEILGSPYDGSLQPESAGRGLVHADFSMTFG